MTVTVADLRRINSSLARLNSRTRPVDPVRGEIWYDRDALTWYYFDEGRWISEVERSTTALDERILSDFLKRED